MGTVLKGALKGILTRLLTAIFKAPLASLAFVYSTVGGLGMTTTFLGDWISSFVGLFWWQTPYVLFFLGVAMIIGDIAREGVAERFAIYLPLFVPSIGLAIPKDAPMRKDIIGWVDTLGAWLDKHIGTYIGAAGQEAVLTLIALTSIAFAVLVCERWKNNPAVTGSAALTPATVSPVGARRRVRP